VSVPHAATATPAFPTHLPAQVPQFPPSLGGNLCRWLLRSGGWRFAGELPDVPKLVLIAAPHSSNWDGIFGLLFKVALRLDIRFVGKREVFFWPLGALLRRLGGIPIDRHAAHDLVAQIAGEFAKRERLWFGLAPEGTRKKVKKWKSGFWHIARAAQVPILPAYFHYPDKTIGVGPLLVPSDSYEVDMAKLRAFYAPIRGKNHNVE